MAFRVNLGSKQPYFDSFVRPLPKKWRLSPDRQRLSAGPRAFRSLYGQTAHEADGCFSAALDKQLLHKQQCASQSGMDVQPCPWLRICDVLLPFPNPGIFVVFLVWRISGFRFFGHSWLNWSQRQVSRQQCFHHAANSPRRSSLREAASKNNVPILRFSNKCLKSSNVAASDACSSIKSTFKKRMA